MRLRAVLLTIIGALLIPGVAAATTNTYSNAVLGFSFDYPAGYTVTEKSDADSFSVILSNTAGNTITLLRTNDATTVAIADQNAQDILIDGSIPAQLSYIYTTDQAVLAISDSSAFLSVSGSGDDFQTVLSTLQLITADTTPFSAALSTYYDFTIDIPATWTDYQVLQVTVDATDTLGSYTEWDFYLPTANSTNAYQLFTGIETYYGKVFALRRYANPENLSVVGWQNNISSSVSKVPTAIATDGDTIFAYILDTSSKYYTDFLNDLGQPSEDALSIVSSFQFTHYFDNFFSDVPSYHLYRRAVEELSAAGIIAGYPDGTFQPDATINRAELIKILVEGAGISPDADTYHHCFSDVTTQWYAPSVCYAQAQGWVQGYPDARFHPERTLNKVEALKMIVAAHGFSLASELSLSTATLFSDTPVTEWYAPYLKTALDRGLIDTTDNDLYAPADGQTRGATAEMIFRVRVAQSMGVDEYFENYRNKVTTGM